MQNKETIKTKAAGILASAAMKSATAAANTKCVFIFHQPDIPTEVKKLSKIR